VRLPVFTVDNPWLSVTLGQPLAGISESRKRGRGTLALTAIENFTNGTTVNLGMLQLQGGSDRLLSTKRIPGPPIRAGFWTWVELP
jgi:autotransporter-associated beta strand protein